VNESEPVSHRRFFCWLKDQTEGPFDLVELAGLFKQLNIGPDTLICREGEDLWKEFRGLPEFASAQEMSIETIARHLEERARAGRSPKATTFSFPWAIATSVICALVVAGFAILLTPAPTPEVKPVVLQLPPVDPWPKTEGEQFSIRCPVPMGTFFGEFRAYVGDNVFRVAGAKMPSLELNVNRMVDAFRDHWVGIPGQHVTVDRIIDVDGHYGREVLYSKVVRSQSFVCGIRAVADGRYFIFAMASLKAVPSGEADLRHFLTSLEVH
jgi:hypothetical protein